MTASITAEELLADDELATDEFANDDATADEIAADEMRDDVAADDAEALEGGFDDLLSLPPQAVSNATTLIKHARCKLIIQMTPLATIDFLNAGTIAPPEEIARKPFRGHRGGL